MDYDPISALEALYRTDLTGPIWLAKVMSAAQPLLDPQHGGLHGGTFVCADPASLTYGQLVTHELDDRLRELLVEGMLDLGEDFIAGTFLSPGLVSGAAVAGWNEICTVRDGTFRAQGLADAMNVVAVEPDGSGCLIGNFRPEPVVLRGSERHLIHGFFRHFVAAHRLQHNVHRRAELTDAILDPDGRVHHARGAAADDPALLAALRTAVVQSEASRGQRRRRDPHGALDAWQALAAGRWTLVDHFEHDGRRYILAVDNAPQSPGWDLLSPRERQVVERAVAGSDNKVIAYDLGIGHSTVKVLMRRAALKLGARNRRELIAKLKFRIVH